MIAELAADADLQRKVAALIRELQEQTLQAPRFAVFGLNFHPDGKAPSDPDGRLLPIEKPVFLIHNWPNEDFPTIMRVVRQICHEARTQHDAQQPDQKDP